MELSEAIDKASDSMTIAVVAITSRAGKVEIQDFGQSLTGETEYDYMTPLKPFVSKWAGVVGQKVRDVAVSAGAFGQYNSREDDEHLVEEYGKVFDDVGVEISRSIFCLGYLLGDPEWDSKPHTSDTLVTALRECKDTIKILVGSFASEPTLTERLGDKLEAGAAYISAVYQQLDMDHTPENVHEWGRLSASLAMFDAFQTGLRARRILEETTSFDQIARNLED